VFILIAGYCVFFRRQWLLPLAAVTAVLQAPSVLEVSLSGVVVGVGAFTFGALILSVQAIHRLARRRDARVFLPEANGGLIPWGAFSLLVLCSAALGPLLFAGLSVYPPLDKLGVTGEVQPLAWSANHVAQAINICLVGGLLVWVHVHRESPALPKWLMSGVLVATLLAVAIGLQQRLAWNGLGPLWAEFWASNPTYAQDYDSLAGAMPRVSWPFVDPSYASAFFAAMFGGFLTMFLAGQRTNAALLGLMVSLFALGNTLGATGSLAVIVVVVLAAAAVLLVVMRRPTLAGALAYRVLLLSLAAGCVALGGYLVLRHYNLLGVFGEAMRNALAGRSHTLLGDIRPHADLMSLKLLVETWGLGVGMGSHRGSSYLITLAANTGVLGLVTFLAANVMHFTLLTRRFIRHPDAPSAFFLGSGISVLIAVSIAIPDQNWPVYWILILGGFACVICPLEGEKMREITPGGDARTVDQEASRAG